VSAAAPPPSVSVVLPTFQNAATLPVALASLAAQGYGGEVELICVDGGSTDDTVAIARGHGARVIENPARAEEEGRALGLEAATGELVLLLDADNELPDPGWLDRLVAALATGPRVVSADCLYHEWRREDPPVTRLCALMGGTDPLAIDLGWGDRWAVHRRRWTGFPVIESDHDGVLVVEIDPDRPPSMGSNGFLVRRTALLGTGYRPFIHSDVVGDLAEAGWRFARVRAGIVHHYAPTVRAYLRKARRRARRSVTGDPPQRRRPPISRWRIVARALWGLTILGPAVDAVRGYRARPDPAWALYPLLYVVTVVAYLGAAARSGLGHTRSSVR
jgi:glycosyltransferase involved in cell wall biosynthesis